MKDFRTLVRFELKKILSRKMTWIAFGLVFLTMVAYAVIEVTVTRDIKGVQATQYEAERQDKENQKPIIGRTVDETDSPATCRTHQGSISEIAVLSRSSLLNCG